MKTSRFFTVLPTPFATASEVTQGFRAKKGKQSLIRSILTGELLGTKEYKDLRFMKDTYRTVVYENGLYTDNELPRSTIYQTVLNMRFHTREFMNMLTSLEKQSLPKDKLGWLFSSVTAYNKAIEYINKKTGHVQLQEATLLVPTNIDNDSYTIFDMYHKVGRKYITISEYQRKYCVKTKGCYAKLCNELDEYLHDVVNELNACNAA